MWLTAERFGDIVAAALDDLPEDVRSVLDNVAVVVEDWPTPRQLADAGVKGRGLLLGLYEGVPQSGRSANYGMVLPDKVTVFRGSILRLCRTEEEVRNQVRRTVLHEIAHHFGIDDDRLVEIDAY